MVISDDDIYRESSQFRKWSFTKAQLEKIRKELNIKARDEIDILQEKKDGYLTVEEEQNLIKYYIGKAGDLCGVFGLPTHVKATCVTYFKRFYLENTVLDHHPKRILYTCLFLACKCENYFIPIDTFVGKLPNTSRQSILQIEFTLLECLGFTLAVHHPFTALYGFTLDIQSTLLLPSSGDDKLDRIGKAHDIARQFLQTAGLVSDAEFLFTPPQIALAALSRADQDLISTYINAKFGNQQQDINNLVTAALDTIDSTSTLAQRNLVSKIDRKLYYIRNPDKLQASSSSSSTSKPSTPSIDV